MCACFAPFISHCIDHIQSSQEHGGLLADLLVAVRLVAGADGDHGDAGGQVDGGGEDERAAGLLPRLLLLALHLLRLVHDGVHLGMLSCSLLVNLL